MGEESSLATRLEACYAGAVHDVLRARGLRARVLPAPIKPLNPDWKLAGPVFTVSGRPRTGADDHETLLAWTGLLSKAPADHVVICQPNDSTLAHMGELSAETMHLRRIRGYMVDGGCRDSDFILKLGFRVFCRYCTPVDVVGRWLPDELGGSITIGGIVIHTGDYAFGDRDGVVIIPKAIVEEVTVEAEKVIRTESLVRKAILEGVDPQEAYLKYGKF